MKYPRKWLGEDVVAERLRNAQTDREHRRHLPDPLLTQRDHARTTGTVEAAVVFGVVHHHLGVGDHAPLIDGGEAIPLCLPYGPAATETTPDAELMIHPNHRSGLAQHGALERGSGRHRRSQPASAEVKPVE